MVVEEPEPPQAVSSDDDSDDSSTEKEATKDGATTSTTTTESSSHEKMSEMSRLFAPYRSIGVVTSGRPFHLIPHQSSASAMICLPIGDRFHMLQCDRLQPILVSQKVPALKSRQSRQEPQHISLLVSDATLSITVVAHGAQHRPDSATLYARTRPLMTRSVVPKRQKKEPSWKIMDFLHLGRMKVPMSGEKEGKEENAAIVAAILTKLPGDDNGADDMDENVMVVGDSDDDDDSDSDSSDYSSDEDDDDDAADCHCQVVILLATRDHLRVHKRISLTNHPNFVPRVALHPSTYVNKIVLGGYSSHTAEGSTKSSSLPALLLLNIRSGKVVHDFSCVASKKKAKGAVVTALEQSPAVDTVAVGTSNGMVHLINLRHDKKLFTLTHKPRDVSVSSAQTVRINSISFRTDGSAMNYGIAPMAVGRSDGTITVWDLNPPDDDNDDNDKMTGSSNKKARKILCEMIQEHPLGVSQLMYLPQEPLLISIGKTANSILMHIFDNPDHSGRILRQRKGHTAPPARIRYLHPGAAAGGGIMVNMADGTDAAACQILSSGGMDRTLRVFSTARTVLDKEYSQGKGLVKKAKKLGMDSTAELLLPPLSAMAMSEARSRDWGDLVTIHKDHAMAYVWSTKRGAQWGPVLRQPKWNVSAMKVPPPPSVHAVSVAMSSCGNFAVVGTMGGIIYKYNVQSGNTRGCYPRDAEEDEDSRKRKLLKAGNIKRTMKALEKTMKISNRASNLDKRDQDAVQEALVEQRRQAKLQDARHIGAAVTGLAVDSTNKTMISVGADAKLILWNFSTHAPHKKSPYKLPSPATMLCHIRDSDLAAIALEDYTTLLFDCTTLSIVRRFGGSGAEQSRHSGPISDLAFSPDGRTLYTASLDSTIRVWDVPTNCCVDWLGFDTPPTSLAISPTGEFLATTHIGKLGLSVWSDRSFYQTVNVNGAKELVQPCFMDEPRPIAEVWETTHGDGGNVPSLTPANLAVGDEDTEDASDTKFPAVAKQDGLVTLSNLPPAHWKNLFHLELIKERNKPKEAPKKPPSAPFFLQWRGGESLGDKPEQENAAPAPGVEQNNDEDEWKAAWSDDDDNGDGVPVDIAAAEKDNNGLPAEDGWKGKPASSGKKRGLPGFPESRIINSSNLKRKKVSHHRSKLASLLQECSLKAAKSGARRFQAISDHIASLGPSAIDVSLSSLCSGMHDLDEGLPLLRLACMWLVEACESRERYEAVNAYLHRFLYLHATVIAGIEDNSWGKPDEKEKAFLSQEKQEEKVTQDEERKQLILALTELRKAQQSALESLRGHMQSSLCLLRHFTRMV